MQKEYIELEGIEWKRKNIEKVTKQERNILEDER
jgi:hypothetical protein